MGKTPKPASVKKLTGNPGRRPVRAVELPDTGAAQMPDYVAGDPDAARLWDRYAPALTVLGTLRRESERLFAMWCFETALYERAPEAFVAARITQIRTLAASLGMDPSAVGKFATPMIDETHDPAEKYFARPRLTAG